MCKTVEARGVCLFHTVTKCSSRVFLGGIGAPLKISTISNIIIKHCCVKRCSKPTQTRIFFFCLLSTRTNNWTKFLHLRWMCVTGHHLTETSSPDLDSTARLLTQRNCTWETAEGFPMQIYHNLHALSKTLCFPQRLVSSLQQLIQ